MPINIRKRGAVYHASGTVAGHRVRESTGCRRRVDAEAWARRRETEILERHAQGPAATYTFAEAALAYIEAGGETRFLTPILDHFGPDTRIAEIDNAAVAQAARAIYPTAAPATINRQLVTPIRAIATMAAEDGLAPFRKFRTRRNDRVRTRWLTPEEADRLIDAAPAHLAPILFAMIGTGGRVSEILEARAAGFNAATGELWIENTKNDEARMLRMPARARDAIARHGIPASGALFRRPDGAPYATGRTASKIRHAFHGARRAAGLDQDVTPHVLRHTWATWFHAGTRDFGALLDLGGWRAPEMAQRYRKAAPQDLADRLICHGWDFQQLGRDMPKMPEQFTRIRSAT